MYFKGLGGGFMERDEIVEYKERTEDDDEYVNVLNVKECKQPIHFFSQKERKHTFISYSGC